MVTAFLVSEVRGADDTASATAILDGKKMRFPAGEIAAGIQATIALLESCHDLSDNTVKYTADDLKKAQKGDHVRLVFAKAVAVTVLGEKLKVSEVVFTQPLNTGVFWLRCGERVVRCTKYEFEKEKDFIAWRNKAKIAE